MANFEEIERFAKKQGIRLDRKAFRRLLGLTVGLGLIPTNRIAKHVLKTEQKRREA